jgi:hypothetical protein
LADFPTTDTIEDDPIPQLLSLHSPNHETTYTIAISIMKVAAFLALIPAAFAVINNEASSH